MSKKTEPTEFDTLFDSALTNALGSAPTASFPKLDCEGTWVVKAVEAAYGPNQAKTAHRGMVKVEVIDNLNGSADKVTARTNCYITVGKDAEMTARNVGPYLQALLALGITKEKLKDDCADMEDVIQNICTIITKQIKLGKEIKFDLQLRANKNKEGEFYKNVFNHVEAVPETESAKDPFEVSADPF